MTLLSLIKGRCYKERLTRKQLIALGMTEREIREEGHRLLTQEGFPLGRVNGAYECMTREDFARERNYWKAHRDSIEETIEAIEANERKLFNRKTILEQERLAL